MSTYKRDNKEFKTRLAARRDQLTKENTMQKSTTKKQLRAAKKLFRKQPNTTRTFTSADYNALPKGGK